MNKRAIVFLVVGSVLILTACGWFLYNTVEDRMAGQQASALLQKLEQQAAQTEEASPVLVVEGEAFCGTVSIAKLGIALPVFEEWDYKKLKVAPCRYTGSVETGDIIIAGHNYQHHFGDLKQLHNGDEIVFTDAMGTRHRYEVKEITTLDGTAVTDMKAGNWDFTLFTCTKSGKQRVTVRCEYVI